jgi:hypothetical protein
MLTSILIAATEHAEPSKTPFYIAGGALVIWALTVSYFGIKQDSFAAPKATGTAIAVVGAALVATTMALSVITA